MKKLDKKINVLRKWTSSISSIVDENLKCKEKVMRNDEEIKELKDT